MANVATLTELKKRELEKMVDDTLRQLNVLINKPQPNVAEIANQMNNAIRALKTQIDKKLNEIKTINRQNVPAGAAANDGFFRRNLDYDDGWNTRNASKKKPYALRSIPELLKARKKLIDILGKLKEFPEENEAKLLKAEDAIKDIEFWLKRHGVDDPEDYIDPGTWTKVEKKLQEIPVVEENNEPDPEPII